MSDTTPEVARLYRSLLMQRSGEERFMMGVRMFGAARTMVLASLGPDLSGGELRRRLFRRMYPDFPDELTPAALRSA